MNVEVTGAGDKRLFAGQWKFEPGLTTSGRPPREKETPFPAEVNYAAEAKAIRYWADVLDYPKRDRLEAARITVSPQGQPDRKVAQTHSPPGEGDQVEGYMWLPKDLAVGPYDVQFDFVDSGGRVLDTNRKTFEVIDLQKTFHWWNSNMGTHFTVEPEFTPIKVDGRRMSIWGRTYDFSQGPFPAAITSKGAQMLARPVAIVVETDRGSSVCRPKGQITLRSVSDTKVEFQGECESDDVLVKARGYLEFDGMLFYDLSLVPKRDDVTVRRVYLSMATKPEHAMYYHTTAGGWSGAIDFVPDRSTEQPFWTSEGFSDFVPYVGFSDDDRAIQWFADNDHNWVLGNDYPCVQLWRHDREVELQVNLVRKSGIMPAIDNVQCGLIATPVKPLPSGWRNPSLHFGRLCNARTAFFYGAGHGGGLALHDTAGLLKLLDVDVPQGTSPDEVLENLSADAQGRFDKLSSDPDGVIQCPFQNAQMLFEGYRSKAFATLFPGDWRIYPPGGWFHLAPTRSYQDFFVWHFDKWLKHLSVRGVYFDETYFPRDYNVFNGSGKIMADGTIRPSVNLMRQRAFMRRVRQAFIDRGVEPFIWVHTSNFMAPHAIGWCQMAMFGEDRAPSATSDYIDTAPEALFRSIGRSQKFGLPPIWMNQVGRGGGTAKGPLNVMARQACGWCWMFDTGVELHSVVRGRPQQWQRVHWGI
ncbi:MAG TPA: glycoside hydrolase domain-containing protein, partial [Thermoguttaceae bacterium]|nr:glycoside hydrolase domain-containing protein [Thermoguttaceae bacterium]